MCNNNTTATPSLAKMPKEVLIELNNRSRWYSSQLWQIPFAYLGLTALAVGQVASKASETNSDMEVLRYVLMGSAFFGLLAILHSILALVAERRTVEKLREVEEQHFRVPEHLCAEYRLTAFPMPLATIGGTIAYWYWWSKITYLLPQSPIAG